MVVGVREQVSGGGGRLGGPNLIPGHGSGRGQNGGRPGKGAGVGGGGGRGRGGSGGGGSGGGGVWPECVGKPGEEAVRIISKARPDLAQVSIIPQGAMVTMDMRMDRVRVFVNENQVVSRPPKVG